MPLDPETFAALIDTVRRFVAQRLRPLEAQVAEEDEVPAEIVAEMRGAGPVRAFHPGSLWRARPHMAEEVRVALEFGRTTPAFRSVFGTNVGIGSQGLVMAGPTSRSPLAAGHRQRRDRSPASPDRARRRLGQRLGADAGGPGRRRVPPHGLQALHHQCRQGQPVHGDGADRRRGGAGASRPSWCPQTCRGSASASRSGRWASRAPMSATSISTACPSPRPTGSARKGRGSRSRCGCSTAAGCTSPRSASAFASG
jgi:hypothetical protein